MLAEKGYADHILSGEEVEELVDEILSQPMPELDGRSIINLLDAVKNGLDFCLYVGFIKQQIAKEAFAFLGRHGANLPRKRDGEITRQRPVLLRGDKTLPEKEPHFAANQCRDELHMKYVQVHFSDLKLNAHLVEDALQTKLQCCHWASGSGGRLAKGQTERDKPPEKDVVYKVFATYNFNVHAAINEGVCYVNH
jgi:hypothetical protein